MIISASRRTDIPRFYSEWLMNRLRAGYVMTRNPFNHAQVKRIDLSPDSMDCIVFWTKDPIEFMGKLTEIDKSGYKYYFQFTLTPYDSRLEKNLRDKSEIVNTFIELSNHIGNHAVKWRYDPIILNQWMDGDWHRYHFEKLCSLLCGHTDGVTISFVDMYTKIKTNLIREVRANEMTELASSMSDIATSFGLTLYACCEKLTGIQRAFCVDKQLIERLIGHPISAKPDINQREGCGCCESVDIGAYNTCANGCVYCYANHSIASVERNISRHDLNGEYLNG